MKFLTTLTLITGLLISAKGFAGAANADLNCIAADGTLLKGSVPGDFSDFDVSIQKGDKAARLYSEINQATGQPERTGDIHAVQDLAIGVYTLLASSTAPEVEGFIQLYAIPKTLVYKTRRSGYAAKFTAKLSYELPGIDGNVHNKTVRCTMKYEI